jgi:integrase
MIVRVTVEFLVDSTDAAQTDLRSQVDAWTAYCRDYDGQARRHVKQQARWVREWLEHQADAAPTPGTCLAWLRSVTRSSTLAPQTVRNRITACRRFCAWLVVQGVLPDNPWVHVPAPRGRAGQGQDALTDEQVEALVARARAQATAGRKPSDRASAANRANLYQFLQLTGLRRGEARAQLWSDIDLQARLMVVTADKARRRDAVPLSAAACHLLSGLAKRGPRVFERIVTDKALQGDLAACGIVGRYSWHSFRSGFITAAFEAGTPPELIQRLVRHRSIDQTHRYLRVKEERLRNAAELRCGKVAISSCEKPRVADRFRVDSLMDETTNTFANSSMTSPSAASRRGESTSRAGLRLVRSRSSGLPTNEKARVVGREPLVSRGDRICNDTRTRVIERLLELNTDEAVLLAGALLLQQGVTREQGSDDSESCDVGAEGRGRDDRDAEPRSHGRDA